MEGTKSSSVGTEHPSLTLKGNRKQLRGIVTHVFCLLVVLRLLSSRSRASNVFFSTDDLEAALTRCNNVLTTYTDPATKKWDTRMSNLTTNWDSSWKLLLEAVLNCEGLRSPNICPHCCEEKVLIRCSNCPKRFYCPSCDRYIRPCLSMAEKGL